MATHSSILAGENPHGQRSLYNLVDETNFFFSEKIHCQHIKIIHIPPTKCKIHESKHFVLLIAVSPISKTTSGPELIYVE